MNLICFSCLRVIDSHCYRVEVFAFFIIDTEINLRKLYCINEKQKKISPSSDWDQTFALYSLSIGVIRSGAAS